MKWILCEDRLPKNDDWKIITILDEHGDTPYRYSDFGWYFDTANCWIVDAEPRTDVIAWMPLPPPYNVDHKTEPIFIPQFSTEDARRDIKSYTITTNDFTDIDHRVVSAYHACGMAMDEPQTERSE